MEPLDVDRIALARRLYDLAERYRREADHWNIKGDPFGDAATTLDAEAYYMTHERPDEETFDVASAYADAYELMIDRIVGVRRFVTVLKTPPTIRKRDT